MGIRLICRGYALCAARGTWIQHSPRELACKLHFAMLRRGSPFLA
jgi:hypothetical protein